MKKISDMIKLANKKHNALTKEMTKHLEKWDDLRTARNGYVWIVGKEEDRMNRREAATRNSERREETIWHKNTQKWGIKIKYDRKRKRIARRNENRSWEARLAHGGAKRSETPTPTNTDNDAAISMTKLVEPRKKN